MKTQSTSQTTPITRTLRVSIEYSCSAEPSKRVREMVQLDISDRSMSGLSIVRVDLQEDAGAGPCDSAPRS